MSDEELDELRALFPAWIILRAPSPFFLDEAVIQALLPFPEHPIPQPLAHYHYAWSPDTCYGNAFEDMRDVMIDAETEAAGLWGSKIPQYQWALLYG